MSSPARDSILHRLWQAVEREPECPATTCLPVASYDPSQRLERLISLMSAMRTRVEKTTAGNWADRLKAIVRDRGLKSLLYAPQSAIGPQIRAAWASDDQDLAELRTWEGDIEDFKDQLFRIDAAVTTTMGAIAETGAIVLWPDESEPRLMSLVPPVHIAVLEADKIYNSFCEIMQAEHWPDHMPTNALLISGPSKTADIEMTLAFGVHGPRELIVLVIEG